MSRKQSLFFGILTAINSFCHTWLSLGMVSRKSCCSFGFCPNYLPPIWTTCTTFFSWILPLGLTKYFDFLIKCIFILRFFNGKLRQDYKSCYSYFLLLTAWIEEKSWNGHNYIIWPPPTVHYVVIPGSQNVHQHHCWLLGVKRGCWDGNCSFVTNLNKPF